MKASAAFALAMVCGFAGTAIGQTANFDSYPEGLIGRDFTEAGIRFYQYDNRLDPPPSNMVAEWADGNLSGQPNFTAPNALGFGGYAPGNGAAFGRFGALEMQPVSGTSNRATINIYEFGNSGGLTIKLEATLNGNVVATDTVALSGGFTISWKQLNIDGPDFDHLKMSVGPNPSDVAFILVDSVTIVQQGGHLSLDPPDPGDAGTINIFAAHDATPGVRVYFVYGYRTGSTNVPGCPGVSVGMRAPTVAGSDVADGGGDAQLVRFVPGSAHNRRVLIQAVEQATCTVSNLVDWTFN